MAPPPPSAADAAEPSKADQEPTWGMGAPCDPLPPPAARDAPRTWWQQRCKLGAVPSPRARAPGGAPPPALHLLTLALQPGALEEDFWRDDPTLLALDCGGLILGIILQVSTGLPNLGHTAPARLHRPAAPGAPPTAYPRFSLPPAYPPPPAQCGTTSRRTAFVSAPSARAALRATAAAVAAFNMLCLAAQLAARRGYRRARGPATVAHRVMRASWMLVSPAAARQLPAAGFHSCPAAAAGRGARPGRAAPSLARAHTFHPAPCGPSTRPRRGWRASAPTTGWCT
jgi:hypothetical protein